MVQAINPTKRRNYGNTEGRWYCYRENKPAVKIQTLYDKDNIYPVF